MHKKELAQGLQLVFPNEEPITLTENRQMEITAVNEAAITAPVDSSKNVFGDQFIGKDGFLKLLITQMQNQNPLEPMSNEDFAAQLAQFSSLEQMQNLNQGFDKLMAMNKVTTSASLIGKSVSYENPETGQTINGVVNKVIVKNDGLYFSIDGKEVGADLVKEISNPQTLVAQ
jgi:flagellar basal-body rod modification protein FlgD